MKAGRLYEIKKDMTLFEYVFYEDELCRICDHIYIGATSDVNAKILKTCEQDLLLCLQKENKIKKISAWWMLVDKKVLLMIESDQRHLKVVK